MIELKLITAIFQGLPETTAMAAVVCALIGRRFDWEKIFAVGALQVITIYLVRLLPVTFGIHTYIAIFTLAIYSHLLLKHNLLKTIVSSIIAMIFLATMENLFQQPILILLDLSMEEASKNDLLWILMGWPQVIALFVAAYGINKLNRKKRGAVDD